jgi:hypothetical protein
MKKRTYYIRRTDDCTRAAWPWALLLAGCIGLAAFLLYLLATSAGNLLGAAGTGIVATGAAVAMAALMLKLQQRGMTVELEPLDDEATDEESEDAEDEPSDEPAPSAAEEPAEPSPSWYDMPYPDPDEEDAEEATEQSPAVAGNEHWSEGDYPDPDEGKA